MENCNLNLASLVGSRICHDLASPLGAITNGLELMSMTETALSPEMQLLQESIENANARLRFLRIAFGKPSDSEFINADAISSILNDLGRSSKTDIVWDVSGSQPRSTVQAAFLAIQCIETALPYGGKIKLACSGDTMAVLGTGESLNQNEDCWQSLETDQADNKLAPSRLQFALLRGVLRDQGKQVRVNVTDTSISIAFDCLAENSSGT